MNVSVGLLEGRPAVEVELTGTFTDTRGKSYNAGRHKLISEVTLTPSDSASCAFALDDITIGIGFHWERKERQVFRGALRLVKRTTGLTVINDVPLEDYVTSVISSEMSASCPLEMLKAHAVISRSWLWFPKANPPRSVKSQSESPDSHEILRWYGREAHPDFDVCADDHCQRYQGITKAFSPAAAEAVRATAGEFLRYNGAICDARFSKCCGGITERYATAWEDQQISYLESIYDGPAQSHSYTPKTWIGSAPPAYCNTHDSELLARVLPGFDQETRDFYRWEVAYTPEELAALIKSRLGADLGPICDMKALARGPSGRIYRLKIIGERDYIIIGKELEIRRALSPTHLYSSAFVVSKKSDRFVLRGAGWGHGVGLCQLGAAVMANEGKTYTEILQHYYSGTTVST
ncbi:MAG: SpoIID/LytB domain-containing protein [Candidatus Binatus sp.]|uniref:SpoIID/LytB domain-containing protein n=1 Tax=Candidatus Binatus sp. TaxID=2811406 RepID=UPI003C737B70